MEPPAQPTDEAMARSWALPGSLITIPDQPWAWGETRHPLHGSQCSEVSCERIRAGPEFEPRAPLARVTRDG